ncbi:MAG: hypothetical protein B7Y25_03800 [Alphaproteobacteria bacterium 16-39-46]|nr:MAG: hypothetical protein B7Y25_03800 [Alphaproteobacteria bacterium 16-39-46]OZA43282.1 MAG: hypothetical protein B7X84_03635 [Alphaproteobacteria bacterium 17-39-52]
MHLGPERSLAQICVEIGCIFLKALQWKLGYYWASSSLVRLERRKGGQKDKHEKSKGCVTLFFGIFST